jgi:hypothetical protein
VVLGCGSGGTRTPSPASSRRSAGATRPRRRSSGSARPKLASEDGDLLCLTFRTTDAEQDVELCHQDSEGSRVVAIRLVPAIDAFGG